LNVGRQGIGIMVVEGLTREPSRVKEASAAPGGHGKVGGPVSRNGTMVAIGLCPNAKKSFGRMEWIINRETTKR
jgi:hypothetical protein